ncbi:hypothetical protein [Streptomyces sp. NPDC002588]|uniref:hypothetical protein n=1 Tax=Streptomyces sp. NPDC002588 TaxID=3154419 RepID=UPI00331B16D2
MTSSRGRGLPHLAVALDRPGVYDAGSYVESARLTERGGLDFVFRTFYPGSTPREHLGPARSAGQCTEGRF